VKIKGNFTILGGSGASFSFTTGVCPIIYGSEQREGQFRWGESKRFVSFGRESNILSPGVLRGGGGGSLL